MKPRPLVTPGWYSLDETTGDIARTDSGPRPDRWICRQVDAFPTTWRMPPPGSGIARCDECGARIVYELRRVEQFAGVPRICGECAGIDWEPLE